MLETQTLEASGAFARPFRPRRVGIVGGGTAGLLTALALKEWQPELEVTLLESSKIPVIGVGEATTPPIVPFLFGYLGIDPHRFERQVKPTWKLGIRFEWGAADPWYFNYAFGDGDLADAQRHDGHPNRYSMTSMLMSADKGPVARVGKKVIPLLNETRFALHLDNERLVAFLHQRARDVGVELVDATLGEVEVAGGHIKRAMFDIGGVGHALTFDLWVDCTGFRSLLLGKALEVPFESYADALFTDTAVTCVRDNGGRPRPYTTATTMQSGWCWQIPMRGEDHLGYVHASRFLDPEGARAELAERFPGARDFKIVRFQSGRRRDFIHGNVVAIGNSYAFVEPLESTAIHMIIVEISRLLGLLAEGGGDRAIAATNHEIGQHWDWLKSFLALHYRFNRRVDSPFWREVHLTTNWSAMEPIVADYQAHGVLSARAEPPRLAGDVVFGPRGIDIVMLGQKLVPELVTPRTTAGEWRDLMAMRDQVVAHALPHGEALEVVAADRRIWDDLIHKESSWVRQMTVDMQEAVPTRGRSQEALGTWAKTHGVPVVLGRDAARLPDEFGASPNIDFGKYLRRVPEVVFRPRDQAQLAECLRHAAMRRMPIRVRGAGHSSGGQTLADEGAVLDLRWLQRIVHDDPAQQRIRVEAGLWWLELCGHLQASGRRPAVLTDNWRSSVGGTLAVGGFGDASHRYGLQVGGVRELVLMTVDGTRHRVKPGDDLFDWSLAGRGQLGIITEVVLDTIARGTTLAARVIEWTSVERYLEDARRASREGRFDWLRARIEWTPGLIVAAAAGHLVPGPDAVPATASADFEGLIGRHGPLETLDVFDKSVEATDSEWRHAAPCVEIVLPLGPGDVGLEETGRVIRRVAELVGEGSQGLARFLPRGSSIMVLPARDSERLPLVPVPPGDHAVMIAIRPEMTTAEVPRHLPTLEAIAELALDAGGRVYLMGVEPRSTGWIERQFGVERVKRLRALKAKWDPDGLLNAGLL